MTTKLYVGNLPDTCSRAALQATFDRFGTVKEFDIVRNYAFVHYEDPEEAKAAVAALHESDFQGTSLRVELSHSRVRHRPGMGDKNECYRCGQDGHWSKDCPKAPQTRKPRAPPADDYQDPYYDPYYRGRYAPPPPKRYPPSYAREAHDPYVRRRPAPLPAASYYREHREPRDRFDPYRRPPPDYYYNRRAPESRPPPSHYSRNPERLAPVAPRHIDYTSDVP